MSGPPWWLTYAWVVSLWVAAGCVGMAGVAAVVDWVTAARGSRTDATGARSASEASGVKGGPRTPGSSARRPPTASSGSDTTRNSPITPAQSATERPADARRGFSRTNPRTGLRSPPVRFQPKENPMSTAEPLVILLAGGRELTEPGIVPGTLADIALNIAEGPVIVRHGACPGEKSADQAASDWIKDCGEWLGVTEDPMPADWDNCAPNCPTDPGHRRRKKPGDTAHPGLLPDYCPTAGPRRNAAMTAKQPRPEYMIAFPEPGQPNYGTSNCIRLAEQAGITVHRFTA